MMLSRFKALLRRLARPNAVYSTSYRLLGDAPELEPRGWHLEGVALRQHQAFKALIDDPESRADRRDFEAAVRALQITELDNPTVLEVGCGTAYYSEVFARLYRRPVRYTGVDVAVAMVRVARAAYPDLFLAVADARALPFQSASYDVVFNGGSLMHIVGTETVVAETVRVARTWCVFHTVPVVESRPTAWLSKAAYGGDVVEVIFNRREIEKVFEAAGLTIHTVLDNIPYDVSAVLHAPTTTLTYVCRRQ